MVTYLPLPRWHPDEALGHQVKVVRTPGRNDMLGSREIRSRNADRCSSSRVIWRMGGVGRDRCTRCHCSGCRPPGFPPPDMQRACGCTQAIEPIRGATYWDPSAPFGYMAAVTSRIKLATNALVLGYRHPLEIAKRYGTLDQVSRERFILGLGVGSLEEEFAFLEADFSGRGDRTDDGLLALRSSLGQRVPNYNGRTPRSASGRRSVCRSSGDAFLDRRANGKVSSTSDHVGDGWTPYGLSCVEVLKMLDGGRLAGRVRDGRRS